jgi:4a-hydroxytetrahydrobiopterin dehydratase
VAEANPRTPALSTAEIDERTATLGPGWRVDGNRLVREFQFPSFSAAFGLATRIALLAERRDHHPDLELGWGRLVVSLTSHDVGALSERDFAMADAIDRLVGRGLAIRDD